MKNFKKESAFTLIELLTVIAIIGILAAIIIPTVTSVKKSANKAKTKVQFSQWAAACEVFKQEYGFYPSLAANTGSGAIDPTSFFANLTARDYNGAALTGTNLKDNKKKRSFYSASDSEVLKDGATAKNEIIDAFGNSTINYMYDADGDGKIANAERLTSKLQGGNSVDGLSAAVTSGTVDTTEIRAGVAFYSAGANNSITDYVYSWK